MYYIIEYYVKKLWYIWCLLIVLITLSLVLKLNNITLISYFEKYQNKISFEPEHFEEKEISKDYLDSLIVGVPYLGTHSRNYIPTDIKGTARERQFLREFEKDPTIVYKKNIDWSHGTITSDQINELTELIGYHLNKNNNSVTTIVKIPSPEQLQEYEQEVMYNTDGKGVLTLNLYVEEIKNNSNTKKTYCYPYRLKYGMDGKITIR